MASIAVDPADPLAIHKLVFLNKPHSLKMLLAPYKHQPKTHPSGASHPAHGQDPPTDSAPPLVHPAINTFDNHLLTPLHLAVMLNRKEMVSLLLKAGANPMARSGSGWTPRQEATSLGDRDLIETLTRHQRREFSGSFKAKAMNLVKQLSNDLDQFYFQLQWEFQSWVPFVSGLCPNDTYHIWKKGNCVRMDTSLVGFENMKWIRGHISIIFRVDPQSGPELVVIDHVKKITQRLAKSSDDDDKRDQEPTDEEIEEEVSTCFNSSITSTNVPTSAIKFQRAKSGLWGYRANKVEKVGEFECAVWKMDGVEFRTRVRTEHLKDESGKPIQPLKRQQPSSDQKQLNESTDAGAPTRSKRVDELEQGAVFKLDNGSKDALAKRHVRHAAEPRRPIHQPLFATFAASGVDGAGQDRSADTETTVGKEASPTLSFEENSSKEQSGVTKIPAPPKKHTRSTGTISDDAFFETVLAEAEGETESEEEEESGAVFRESLPPPPPTRVTFEEYFEPSAHGELHLGRPLEQKESRKTFGATLWMYDNNGNSQGSTSGRTAHDNASQASIAGSSVASSQEGSSSKEVASRPQFPLTIEKLLPLLEVIGMDNNRLVGKLKEFLEFQLPPGFPVRANIPVYPSLSADVTFVNYDAQRVIEDDHFKVPGEDDGYTEGHVIRPGGEDDT
ncbi:Ankyrin repeat domain-containing protein 13C [Dissophora globulifera]|uniref:Ankyrin repeat domain-containing protein 13C n=1 Tax=Dissophora globulifera TaxID=979702 RepID=A0A9P6UZE9_9FUNG|nr:Ankyrin repeat domain-containing protein 13C [Dissophora globulifera]